jgi:serine/threonine protein kinase
VTQLPAQIGRYQILGRLGSGGMAEVLVARLVSEGGFERPMVLKRILPELAKKPEFVKMFLEEARMAGMVWHQNVVQIFELVHESGELYLVMEYLEGETASGLARRLAATKKLLAFGLAAHVVAEVCAGLHAAHELVGSDDKPISLVHRDVSPGNIHLSYDGQVKILDFGIATPAGIPPSKRELKGKVAYMSPEQCRGDALDRRSDIFSLGAVLYELSTCRRLFKRNSDQETVDAILSGTIVPPSKLVADYPKELERICLRALERNRDARYATAIELRKDLLAVSNTLNQGKVPSESLAKVMQKLFADRRAERRALLRATPEDPRFGIPPMTDPSIEIPEQVLLATMHSSSISSLLSAAPAPAPTPVVTGIISGLDPRPSSSPAVPVITRPPPPTIPMAQTRLDTDLEVPPRAGDDADTKPDVKLPPPPPPGTNPEIARAEPEPTPDLPIAEAPPPKPVVLAMMPDPADATPLPMLVSTKKRNAITVGAVLVFALLIVLFMRS